MSYNVTDFLGGLFGDRPQPPAAAEPEPQADDAAGEPSGTPDFSDWVRRPDCNGRMGWEPPDLPEAARWWAHGDFEDLPEAPDTAKRTAQEPRCSSKRNLPDSKHVGGDRPSDAMLGALAGCEAGQGQAASYGE